MKRFHLNIDAHDDAAASAVHMAATRLGTAAHERREEIDELPVDGEIVLCDIPDALRVSLNRSE